MRARKQRKVKAKKPAAPLQLEYRGYTYERVSKSSVEVELDLEEDVLTKIDMLVEDGMFVSRADAIRHMVRSMLESHRALEHS